MTVSRDARRSRNRRIACLLTVGLFGIVSLAAGQTTPSPDTVGDTIKLGILPFADATGSASRTAGADVGRTMMSEVVHSTDLQPRMLTAGSATRDGEVNGEKAIALAREQHVDLVFVGTVLEARSEASTRSGWIPSIKGQSGSVSVHRVNATVTLQGELYEVATGRRLFSVRVTGNEANNALGGTAYTTFGAWGNDSYSSFLDSPMGKALQKALADMTKKIAAAK